MKIGETKLICVEAFTGKYADGSISVTPQPKLDHIYTFDGYNPLTSSYFLVELTHIDKWGCRSSFIANKLTPLDEVLSDIEISEVAESLERTFQTI